ncbi:MAG: elongator complex protein 3 [Thermodesulfobacteriota bacterium]
MYALSFEHPEPNREQPRIIPVFIPFAGCPGRCIYCAQREQTGEHPMSLSKIFSACRARLAKCLEQGENNLGLAFYGGTFTALPWEWQLKFIKLAADFKSKGVLTHIRCSTRPDFIDLRQLDSLQKHGLDLIELGIQTFNDVVLQISRRGYNHEVALDACEKITGQGLELGLQMLPGLPGHSISIFMRDIEQVCDLSPSTLRLYPCLVIGNTELTSMWRQGKYRPWSLDTALGAISLVMPEIWKNGIKIIRIGLAPEADMLNALHAGPWHESFGSICRGMALRDMLLSKIRMMPGRAQKIMVPYRYVSDFWGFKRSNAAAYQKQGITRKEVDIHNGSKFIIMNHSN